MSGTQGTHEYRIQLDMFFKSYEFDGIDIESIQKDTIKKYVKKYDFMRRVGKQQVKYMGQQWDIDIKI